MLERGGKMLQATEHVADVAVVFYPVVFEGPFAFYNRSTQSSQRRGPREYLSSSNECGLSRLEACMK